MIELVGNTEVDNSMFYTNFCVRFFSKADFVIINDYFRLCNRIRIND